VVAYEPEGWHDLFVAMAGAAAALAGLLFVAVSINLTAILKFASLPRRALETLLIMLAVVLLSIFVLVPGQDSTLLGLEILALGLGFLLATLIPRLRLPREDAGRDAGQEAVRRLVPLVALVASFVPMVVAGLSLLIGAGGGLYWLVPSLVFAFLTAITSAWVLLVEILR
jgi:hypothetical protein